MAATDSPIPSLLPIRSLRRRGWWRRGEDVRTPRPSTGCHRRRRRRWRVLLGWRLWFRNASALLADSDFGADLVIAIIDIGISPTHRSFHDRGLGPVSPKGAGCARRGPGSRPTPPSATRAVWPPGWRPRRSSRRTRCAGWAAAWTPTSSWPSTPTSPMASTSSCSASVAPSCCTTLTPSPLGRSALPRQGSWCRLRPAMAAPVGSCDQCGALDGHRRRWMVLANGVFDGEGLVADKKVNSLEQLADELKERCSNLHKGCKRFMVSLDEGYAGDLSFADALEAFGAGQDDPVSVAIGGPVMSKFTTAFRELGTYKELLRSQVEHMLSDRLMQFINADMHGVKDCRQRLDRATMGYDQAREKFVSVRKGTRADVVTGPEEDLHNAKSAFERCRFNLVHALANIEAKKKYEFLESISAVMDAHLRYFKQAWLLPDTSIRPIIQA